MPIREYRLIDAKKKLGIDKVKKFETDVKVFKKEINPKRYQSISMDGHIIVEGNFSPDTIIRVVLPRKPRKNLFKDMPKSLQEEINKLQDDLKLTQAQMKEIKKTTLKNIDLKEKEIEQLLKIIKEKAIELKKESDKEKYINSFNKSYFSFSECLDSRLKGLNTETKKEIIEKLENIIEIINDTMKSYLK